MPPKDRDFLRETALRTWRYFADHCSAENHWLVPDNVQEDPPLVANHISPTNLGFSLTAQLAAHDFGYLSLDELSSSMQRILDSMEGMPRYRGHFFNWYETEHSPPAHAAIRFQRRQREPGRLAGGAAPGLSAVAERNRFSNRALSRGCGITCCGCATRCRMSRERSLP